VAAAALLAALPAPAAAQSTIFNIPTTDTVAPGKGYFEFDYLKQLPSPDDFSFQVVMPRVVVGLTPQIEAGLNWSNTIYSDDAGTFSYVQPNVKYRFYANDDQGVAAAAGVIGYFAANKRDSSDDFGMVYGEVSKKFTGSAYGPRVHGGVYGSLSYGDDNTGGVILGYEQPVAGNVSVVADWFSGKNFWGYFTPGVSILLPRNGLLNIGYSLGNDSYDDPSNDNRAFFIYYGLTFP
jgi:hypothetical protein